MDNLGDIIAGISVVIMLAAIGVSTVVALALMAALGLITEMSFKRLFFVSFGLGLLVPMLVAGAGIAALQSSEVQNEIRAELRDALPLPAESSGDQRGVLPQIGDVQRGIEDGTLGPDELEQRLEELIPGSDVQIDDDGFRITTSDDADQGQN